MLKPVNWVLVCGVGFLLGWPADEPIGFWGGLQNISHAQSRAPASLETLEALIKTQKKLNNTRTPTMIVEPLDSVYWTDEHKGRLTHPAFMRATLWQGPQNYSIVFQVQNLAYTRPPVLASFVKQKLIQFIKSKAFLPLKPVLMQGHIVLSPQKFQHFVQHEIDPFINREYTQPLPYGSIEAHGFIGPMHIKFEGGADNILPTGDDSMMIKDKTSTPLYEIRHHDSPQWRLQFSQSSTVRGSTAPISTN